MAYRDLREFIAALEKAGELKRIPFEVDPHLEITEFADRSVKTGGPALLFEKPKGSSIPVLINAFASMKRMEIALGVGTGGRGCRSHHRVPADEDARGHHGEAQDAADACRYRFVLSQDRR
jgi:UbiD family decarboxylase